MVPASPASFATFYKNNTEGTNFRIMFISDHDVDVYVLGPVDRHGYCEAEVGGRTGLVPASHLYPLTDSAATYRPASQPHSRHKVSGLPSLQLVA